MDIYLNHETEWWRPRPRAAFRGPGGHPPLSENRDLHVLGVLHTAAALAARHGMDVSAAALAALLHDRFKADPPAKIEADMRALGAEIDPDDRPFPSIWHGPRAALHARVGLKLTAAEGADAIAEAVALHSTGEAGAGPLARLMLVADSIEPTRDFEGVEALRELARVDLEAGFAAALDRKISFLRDRGMIPSPRAERAGREAHERNPGL